MISVTDNPPAPSAPVSRAVGVQHRPGLWHFPARGRGLFSLCGGVVMAGILAGCGGLPPVYVQFGAGGSPAARTYPGLIAADEPQATLAARNVLLAGGNAVDAAVTLGFALTVTLPSSAGLGGGGACIVHDVATGRTETLDFTTRAAPDDGATRFRTAIPALPRGLFALHAKYGKQPWAQLVAPAENLARFGQTVSRAFASALAADGGVLADDPMALAAFMTPRRQLLQIGDALTQIDLATMLGRLRARGPGDLYAGTLGNQLEAAVAAAGASLSAADLRATVPQWLPPVVVDEGVTRLFALSSGIVAGDFAVAFAEANPTPILDERAVSGSTAFVVADGRGNAVACGLSMGRPFGLGIIPRGVGFLLAPAPGTPTNQRAAFAPVIGLKAANKEMIFAVAATGFGAANEAAAMARKLAPKLAPKLAGAAGESAPPDGEAKLSLRHSGLVNYLTCGANESIAVADCRAQNDPRGAGYAIIIGPKEYR